MKYIIITIFLILLTSNFLYGESSSTKIRDDADIPYKLMSGGNPNIILGYYKGNQEITQEEYENYTPYKPVDLIEWGISQYPELIGTPHEYSLVEFAKNPKEYKNLFLSRSIAIDTKIGGNYYTTVANEIISKAVELGADIE